MIVSRQIAADYFLQRIDNERPKKITGFGVKKSKGRVAPFTFYETMVAKDESYGRIIFMANKACEAPDVENAMV